MPEGPSILILKEKAMQFKGQTVREASGNAKIEYDKLLNQRVVGIKSWGKHFLIEFKNIFIRVHLLMFGTYTFNEEKENRKIRLHLGFDKGYMNIYAGAIKMVEEPLDQTYDFSADVMNDKWSPIKALKKLKENPEKMVCDILLDQDVFSGVGNIIKNEVLYRIKVHPETIIGNLSLSKQKELIKEARNYSFDFLKWKKENTLKKHWLIYHKKKCPKGHEPVERKDTGKKKRASFYCEKCQKIYN